MLYGEFKSVDVGILTFDAEVIDDVTVKHYEVATFKATTNFYRMRTLSGGEYFGWVLPGDTGNVIIYDLIDSTEIPIRGLVFLTGFEEDFRDRWSGLIGAGYSYTRSSDIGRFNFDLNVHYKGEKVDLDFAGSAIFTSEDGAFVREREEASFVVNRYVSQKWSIFGLITYQRNEQLGLKYRYQSGSGLTYSQYLTNQIRLGVGAGIVYNTEENFEGDQLESFEMPLFTNFRLFKYREPNISLIFDQSVYIGLTEIGRVRHDGELRLKWEIIDDLSIDIKLYDNYDSQSPSTGQAALDYGIVSGISYSL